MPAGRAENLIDEGVRTGMLGRADGRLAHIETEYNDVFITKRGHQLVMSFQLKGWDYTESVSNLLDPDDLPLRYAQVMTIATIYPEAPRKILMLGLGGGSISTYLGRFMPEAAITTVEIDPGVITAAKTYFGLRETERMRYHAGDGRVFLNRNSELYDLILLDAYRGGYVPFHLLTREFYTLVKQRLAPGGAATRQRQQPQAGEQPERPQRERDRARSDRRNEDERGSQRADDGARGGDAIDRARDATGSLRRAQQQPNGKR